MLVNLEYVINMAEKGNFAIPAFNVYNTETVMGVVKAAEELRAPIIMQVYPRLLNEEVGYYLCPAIVAAARKATVPVCFHLDHGPTEKEVQKALRWGATGIMYDGSIHPFDENVENTKHIVEMCDSVDVTVEGELGHVGSVNDDFMDDFTDPDEAAEFVKKTGVTCLAVLIGNAHGHYKKPPKLDIERITAIREATNNAALVLHGGSGVPDEEVKKAVKAGIRKMNFATDICYAFLDTCLAELQKPDRAIAIDSFMKKPIDAVKDFCITRIKLVNADGKA